MVELVPGLGNEIRKSSEWIYVKLSLLFHHNKTSLMHLGKLFPHLVSCAYFISHYFPCRPSKSYGGTKKS